MISTEHQCHWTYLSSFCFLAAKSSTVSSSFFTSSRRPLFYLSNALPFANKVKQFLSSFSASLMVATNSSSNDLLTSKSSLRFKLTLLISDITIHFSLLISCLALVFSTAIRLSFYSEYAALHEIMSCRLIWKLCGFTEWEIMWSLTIFFDTINSVLLLTIKIIDISNTEASLYCSLSVA